MHKYLAKDFEKYKNEYYNEYSTLHFSVGPKERTHVSTPNSTRRSANTHKISRVLIRIIRVLLLASRTLLMSSFTRVSIALSSKNFLDR